MFGWLFKDRHTEVLNVIEEQPEVVIETPEQTQERLKAKEQKEIEEFKPTKWVDEEGYPTVLTFQGYQVRLESKWYIAQEKGEEEPKVYFLIAALWNSMYSSRAYIERRYIPADQLEFATESKKVYFDCEVKEGG